MAPGETASSGGLGYQPSLDGLRAVAVGLVLLFHQGFGWMSGGYVGVSVFFTLSGYLITYLLAEEWSSTATISIREFYGRRVRRLLPASLACLAGISVVSSFGVFPPVARLDRAVIGALLQIGNWEALTRGSSYAALLTGGATPVDHFWSLAVEEQFYWCWPLVMVAIFRLTAGDRRRSARIVVAAAVAFIALGPITAAVWGPDAAYWSTPARLGEILTGAALAMVVRCRGGATAAPRWSTEFLAWAGVAAVAAASVLLPADSGPAYSGLLGVGSLASVAILVGLRQHDGLLRRLLSARPLVVLGTMSYGIYLYHWPVFLALRPGDSSAQSFALRVALTLAIASVSYRYLELPFRTRRRRLGSAGAAGLSLASLGIVGALALTIAPDGTLRYDAPEEAAAAVSIAAVEGPLGSLAPMPTPPDDSAPSSTTASAEPPTTAMGAADPLFPEVALEAPSRPVRVLVLGDSTGIALGSGLISWAADHRESMQVTSLAAIGCGVIRDAWQVAPDDPMRTECDRLLDEELPRVLEESVPDVIVVHVSLVDAVPRLWDDTEGVIPATDSRYVERLDRDYSEFTAYLLARSSARILWVMPTLPAEWFLGRVNGDFPPEWWSPQRAAIARASTHPRILSADLGQWISLREAGGSRRYREDGLHLSDTGARLLADEALAEGVLALALGLYDGR
ncbi:MAG: acyltransferase family protein [Ilumatobacteraceae bacterium]